MTQCSILYIQPPPDNDTHVDALRALGFSVDVRADVLTGETFASYHAVVIRVNGACNLPVLGTRLRAKARFGRRVLIGLVPESCTERQRRDAAISGFDAALPANCTTRDLAAHILKRLRQFPEYRCLLRSPEGRRKAA